jgi:predicted RNase H-like HicB family nuclease
MLRADGNALRTHYVERRSRSKIHSALAYYWDHREELDLEFRRCLERVGELRSELRHPELAALRFVLEERSQGMKYRVLIEQDEDGMYVAEVPSLPGCISQGQTREEAVENIREAIAAYLESLEAHGDPIPPPITEEVVEVNV